MMLTPRIYRFGKGITAEVAFLPCRAGKFISFSSLFCKVLGEKNMK